MRYRDSRAWAELRRANADWLRPWDPTPPRPGAPVLSYRQMVRRTSAQARAGEAFPWAITYDDELCGQCTVGAIAYGSALSASIGYWVDRSLAGRGIVPTAVALAVDHAFFRAGLHRIEVNIRPENTASLRVVEKLGLRAEGRRERMLHIDGDWRDHLAFAVTVEEVPDGLLSRWHQRLARGGVEGSTPA